MSSNVIKNTIRKYYAPLYMRAKRISEGVGLDVLSQRLNVKKPSITPMELQQRYFTCRTKQLVHKAYGVTDDELQPSEETVDRLYKVLSEYSEMEIQMIYDLSTAQKRHEKWKETRKRNLESYKKYE